MAEDLLLSYLDHPDGLPAPAPVAIKISPFSVLSTLMKSVIDREESVTINIDIEKKNNLTHDQGDKMMSVIRKVILQTIRPNELVATIQKEIGLDEARAKKLALDLLGRRFLPMEFYLGSIRPLIQQLGGNVEQYLAEAKKLYPEVYAAPVLAPTAPEPAAAPSTQPETTSHPILSNFDQRLTSFQGRAEILLRLTGLSAQVEDAIKAKKLSIPDGQQFMQQLDAVSYAINTQDLNPLEVQSIKRRLTKLLAKFESVGQ